jgi:hypothetical protein
MSDFLDTMTSTQTSASIEDDLRYQEQQRVAVRVIAAAAHDADDARLLFDALGLDPRIGVSEARVA